MVGVTVRQTVQCCMFIPGGVGRHVYMHYAVPVVSKCVIPPVEYCGYCAAAKDAPRKLESTATKLGKVKKQCVAVVILSIFRQQSVRDDSKKFRVLVAAHDHLHSTNVTQNNRTAEVKNQRKYERTEK